MVTVVFEAKGEPLGGVLTLEACGCMLWKLQPGGALDRCGTAGMYLTVEKAVEIFGEKLVPPPAGVRVISLNVHDVIPEVD